MNGGTCGGDCRGGSNDGQACVLPAECPGGYCFPGSPLFAEDMCGDAFGNVYVPEYFDVESDVCDRIERLALTQYRKSNGPRNVIAPQLDSDEGIDSCNDRR